MRVYGNKNFSSSRLLHLLSLTDSVHLLLYTVTVQPGSLGHHLGPDLHADTWLVPGVVLGPDEVLRDGRGAIEILPLVDTNLVEVRPQTDGELLRLWSELLIEPVLDTGPLCWALHHHQVASHQTRIVTRVGGGQRSQQLSR